MPDDDVADYGAFIALMAVEGIRQIPHDWREFAPSFIDEVKRGIHASWKYMHDTGMGEAVIWTSDDGQQRKVWQLRRARVLGEPVDVVVTHA